MRTILERFGRRVLFAFDPETAHGLSIRALTARGHFPHRRLTSPLLRVEVAGLVFPNPLGLAAGYDKNAEVPDAVLGLGFGFAECGTVTPRPQAGNPKPRIFRLAEDAAVINRLGFNNEGHAAFEKRLRARGARPGVVGVNVGANADSSDRIADYETGVARFARLASYLVVNVSSPNTKGLRALQGRDMLGELLARVMAARNAACGKTSPTPLFLKIAPDLDEAELADVSGSALDHGVDGLIISNTTLARGGLRAGAAGEQGGLSGAPLFARATTVLAKMRRLCGPRLPIIGVGGVNSVDAALEKIRAGADLVQLYTGMIYGGPGLPASIVRGMDDFAEREGLGNIAEIRDSRLEHWAGQPLR